MAARSNAISELTRFWLEARHNCLTGESIPVKVFGGNSDIDLIASRPDGSPFTLPTGASVGPRLIVEAKDEHDYDKSGREFGKMLRADAAMMGQAAFISDGTGKPKFTMLRQQHFDKAVSVCGSTDFDRLFVIHAVDPQVQSDLGPMLAQKRIYMLGIREVVKDLQVWYSTHSSRATLRHTLVGDLIHLLWGYCVD
jgi:hypothetical protein